MLWTPPGAYTSTLDEMSGKLVCHQDISYRCAHETFSVSGATHDNYRATALGNNNT